MLIISIKIINIGHFWYIKPNIQRWENGKWKKNYLSAYLSSDIYIPSHKSKKELEKEDRNLLLFQMTIILIQCNTTINTYTCMHTCSHTHKYIHIYVYIWICLVVHILKLYHTTGNMLGIHSLLSFIWTVLELEY